MNALWIPTERALNCRFRPSQWWENEDVRKRGAGMVPLWIPSLLTSVAFFSASSSFSWASLRASEYLSNSSSVPFSFFCRASKSSSSWGEYQCADSFRGDQRGGAWARTAARVTRTETRHRRGQDRTGQGRERGEKLGEPMQDSIRYLGGGLLSGQQLFLSSLELLKNFISFVLSNAQFLFQLSYVVV